MKKKHVLAMALLLTAMSISTQAKAAERVVVAEGEMATISSENFENLSSTENGAAVYAQGNLTINGGKFIGNSTEGDENSGGAIFVDAKGKTITISGSEFSGNSAVGYVNIDTAADGSAISVKEGTVKITGTEFKSNTASWGTIYQYSKRNGQRSSLIDIDDCLLQSENDL